MASEFQLIISERNYILKTVTQEVNTKHFVQSLEEFQIAANETLTKMIEDLGCDSSDLNMDDDEDSESSEIEDDVQVTNPKKRKCSMDI